MRAKLGVLKQRVQVCHDDRGTPFFEVGQTDPHLP